MSAVAARSPALTRWVLLCLSLLALIAGCSARKQDLLQVEKLQRDGQTEAALSGYLRIYAQVPQEQRAAASLIELRIAECLWKLGRNREAYTTLQRAVEEYPANTTAQLRLAELLLSGGAPEEAKEHAAVVLWREPQLHARHLHHLQLPRQRDLHRPPQALNRRRRGTAGPVPRHPDFSGSRSWAGGG